jgi:hypothetical protein
MVNAHTPRFVSRIEEHITHEQAQRNVLAHFSEGR